MKQLDLKIPAQDYYDLDDPNDVWKLAAQRFPDELIKFANIDSDTEHNLDNFGDGSAWIIESPYELGLRFSEDFVIVTVYGP